MNEMEKNPQDKVTDRWFHFLYAVIWPFFNLFRPLKVIGRENIPDGAAVLCPNHTTIGDPFYVVFAFGRRYPMRAMAKIQIMRVPFIGWILGKGGVFGVDRLVALQIAVFVGVIADMRFGAVSGFRGDGFR